MTLLPVVGLPGWLSLPSGSVNDWLSSRVVCLIAMNQTSDLEHAHRLLSAEERRSVRPRTVTIGGT
jgi:hypothetical protein